MKKILNKVAKPAVILLIILIVFVLGINLYIMAKSEKLMYSPSEAFLLPKDADCIIVLGAGLRNDGTPNHMLRDRLDLAIKLYKDGICKKLLLTGDRSSEDYDEVTAMKEYATKNGVDERDLLLDNAGFSTYDSIYRAKNTYKVDKAIVITQKYHLYRALYISDSLGIKTFGVNSDPFAYAGQAYRDIREVFARVKDFFLVF